MMTLPDGLHEHRMSQMPSTASYLIIQPVHISMEPAAVAHARLMLRMEIP